MVTITLDPITTIQHGGLTLTGDAPSDYFIQWWINNSATINTHAVTRDGTRWQLDLPLIGSSYIINIRASNGSGVSNVVTYSLNTKAEEIVTSFQYNEIDELASLNGVYRIPGESNVSLKNRGLDAYARPGNSSKLGQSYAIERALGLPHLDPFFFISARINILTKKPYKNGYVYFGSNYVEAELDDWIISNELLDLDPISYTATLSNLLGDESRSAIKVSNADKFIPDYAIKVEGNSIFIDPQLFSIDLTKETTITYPYKKRLDYNYYDDIEHLDRIYTVLEVKSWLEDLDTVVNEEGLTVSTIVWNDGYLVNADPSEVVTYDLRTTVEHAQNNPPAERFVKIEESINDYYLEYINAYPYKGFFLATQIHSIGVVPLSDTPLHVAGSWIIMNYFADRNFQEKLKPELGDKNLEFYANILRRLVRMGMDNSIVNFDYWGSDSPTNIGDNFVPSYRDKDLVGHTILTEEGGVQTLSLNQRRYYAKKLAVMHR